MQVENYLPLVSIVIPVFNCREYLSLAIDSVLLQDYKFIECIVVDDGSTDGVDVVLKKYLGRIKVIRQENAGQSAALEAGWKISSGKLLGYLSADDILYPNAISELVSLYFPGRLAVYYGRYDYIDECGRFVKPSNAEPCSYQHMAHNFYCPVGVGVLFSSELFERLGGWDSRYKQMPDLECWLRYGALAQLVNTDERLGGFRVHTGSQTYLPSSRERANEPLEIAKSSFMKSQSSVRFRRFVASACVLSGCLHLRSGRPLIACGLFGRSLLIAPVVFLSKFQIKRILGSAVGYLRLSKEGLLKK